MHSAAKTSKVRIKITLASFDTISDVPGPHLQIVTALFPSNVRDRLLEQGQDNDTNKKTAFVNSVNYRNETSLPIADLFPEASVLFAGKIFVNMFYVLFVSALS